MVFSPLLVQRPTDGLHNGTTLHHKPQNCPIEMLVHYESYLLPQDLTSVKSQEGYTVVECDEIEGSNNVSTMGDDFTVETALEDLEFGFTVIKSTQQVSIIESFALHR